MIRGTAIDMPDLERLGSHSTSNRDLYLLELSSSESLTEIQLASPYFVALVIWDVVGVSATTIASLAELLIDSGCSYVCLWGQDCERMHDVFDEQINVCNPNPNDSSVILTTWHADESLDETLWYFLNLTWPADDYFDESNAGVVITVNTLQSHVSRVQEILKQSTILESHIVGD